MFFIGFSVSIFSSVLFMLRQCQYGVHKTQKIKTKSSTVEKNAQSV